MSILERNCKWHFGKSAKGNSQGPNSLSTLKFNGSPLHSLIRESIQNSLDAVDDVTKPVVVSFQSRGFNGREFPNFFEIKKHIQACLDAYRDGDGERKFIPMLKYFDNLGDNDLEYLKVEDSNTVGMAYEKGNKKCPLEAFISEGVASKSDKNAGGSFGFGKAVFWMTSQISTIFVSTKPKDDEKTYFVGLSKLCTHSLDGETDLLPNGIYSTNGNGDIICEINDIPDYFVRKETGTSIYAIGVNHFGEEEDNELIKAVLRNFWMAIYSNKLVVKIEKTEISRDTLPQLMETFFDDIPTTGRDETKAIDIANPRPYYELMRNANNNTDGFHYIQDIIHIDSLNEDWPVKLYLHQREDANNSVEFMRSPLMTVYIDNKKSWKKIEGVFICDSDKGNRFLREMEDCSHNSWTPEGYMSRNPDQGDRGKRLAGKVKRTIEAFIDEQIKQEMQSDLSESENIAGLEDLLYIQNSQDLKKTDKNDDIIEPNSIIVKKSKLSNIIKDTFPDKRPTPPVRRQRKTKAEADPNGDLKSNNGRKKKKKSFVPGPIKPGTMVNRSRETENGKTGIYAEPVDVRYRTWSQIDTDGTIWHIIRVKSDILIENAIVSVYGINADGNSKPLNIVEAPDYVIRQGDESSDEESTSNKKEPVYNAVSGIRLQPGIATLIKIRFESNIKYALSIYSDKIESNEE